MSVVAFPHAAPEVNDLAALAEMVEHQHQIVDARLPRAARWRGAMRREIHGHARPGDHDRYEEAYNRMVDRAISDASWALDTDTLREIHAIAAGDGEFRKTGLLVGGHHNFPGPHEVPMLVDRALAFARSSIEPPAAAAARLHLNLISIHPFTDGNGRSARLAASLLLARAGFRSTLLVAIEQHSHPEPRRYLDILDQYQFGEIGEEACIASFMQAMIANCIYASWFRSRENCLRECCESLQLKLGEIEESLLAYDLGSHLITRADVFSKFTAVGAISLRSLLRVMTGRQRSELSYQLQRLLDEEEEATEELRRPIISRSYLAPAGQKDMYSPNDRR